MGAITSYQCDGPECTVLTEKPKGNQYPPLATWPRVTLRIGGHEHTGAFHAKVCALRWADDLWNDETAADGLAEHPAVPLVPSGAPPIKPGDDV